MSTAVLSQWQFAITSTYHFLFVPLTLGLTFFLALLETCHVRTKDAQWKKESRKLLQFFSTVFLINFAMGVVTGIVQEFHFGMNWSEYARFMGDIFGAPLALEALSAFFLESTFLGIWIFGWDKLSPKLQMPRNGVSHPLARVLVASAVSRGARLMRVSATSSIPGKGVEALINGRAVRLGKREWLEEEGVQISNSLLTQGDQFASRGKIVIYLATGKIAKGLLVFSDEARSDMPRTIRLLESLGVQTVMMTGDCRTAAKRTAKDAGISVYRADLAPADKAKEVQMLQAHGHSVALLAAKKEDAEAASMADVVLAMQTSESEIAPDILIASGDPSHIPQLITLSRKTVRTVRLALSLAFLAAVLAAVLLHASLFFLGDLRFLPLLSVLSMLAGIVAATLVPLGLKGFKFAPHTLDY